MESGRYSKHRGLDFHGPPSAASLVPEELRTQHKAAKRLWSHMHSRTMNKIYPLGARHAALQAGAWSYGRRGSCTGWQEGGVFSAWRWSSNETPQPAEAHQRAKLSWHCHQLKGVFCKICHALFAIATSLVSGGL